MPIYEFYCAHCHRIFSFLSRAVNTDKTPACPKCGLAHLTRRPSAFAISRNREEPKAPTGPDLPDLPPGMDEARLERAMEQLAAEAEGLDESDPRQGVQLMRRLFDATGMPIGKGMEEALRRMEAGEDPEKVEEEMGDSLEDPFGMDGGDAGVAEPEGRLSRLRKVLPRSVDRELHEL
jgi:putative FmdB family regulatory protein